eukprot:1711024-Ditylum_brightwellii.AAC.1
MVNRLSAKEAGSGANAATLVTQNTMSELEEAMNNLAYAATISNSALETLTDTNKKLMEQLKDAHSLIKRLQNESATHLRIIETSVTGKAPTPPTTPRPPTSPRKNCRRGKIDYRSPHGIGRLLLKPGHQLGATRENTMNGSRAHHWWKPKRGCVPVGSDNLVNIVLKQTDKFHLPSWIKQHDVNETALTDSAASLTLLNGAAPANKATMQENNKQTTIPNGNIIHTTETLTLQVSTLPQDAKCGF